MGAVSLSELSRSRAAIKPHEIFMTTWICARCGETRQQDWIPTNWVTLKFCGHQNPNDRENDWPEYRRMLLCEGCYSETINFLSNEKDDASNCST
jgi:hypothetical protein